MSDSTHHQSSDGSLPFPQGPEKGSRRRLRAAVLAIIVLLLARGQAFGVTFTGIGIVLSLIPSAEVIVLDHEAIEACMPPMKMGFYVDSVEILKGLKRGDRVRFTFTIKGPAIVITEITKIGG